MRQGLKMQQTGLEQMELALKGIPDEEPTPITLHDESGYSYSCPSCPTTPLKSKNAMVAHINKEHLGKDLLCEFCSFTSYNPDSLSKHVKQKHV